MYNLNRRLLLGLGLSAAAVGLAGCGDDGGGTDEPVASEDIPKSGTITVWCWDPAFNLYSMKEAEKVYQKTSPDVKLNIVETPWDDVQTKLTTIAQSKAFDQLPDIFLCQNNAFQKNVENYPDLFADFGSSGIKYDEFPEGVVGYSKFDDKNWGCPFDNGTAVNALRTDILEQAGFTVEDFTDITWTDFIAKGKEVLGKTGKGLMSGEVGSPDILSIMLQSAGGSFFTEDGKANLKDNEKLIKSLEAYRDIVAAKIFTQVNSWDEYIATFINSKVGGVINGVWILGSVQTAKDQSGKWAVTNIPKLDGVDGATNYSANGGSSWAITPKDNKVLAADFLAKTFAGSKELYETILPKAGALANWIPAADSAVYKEPQEYFGGDAIYSKVVDYAQKVPAMAPGAYYYEARDAVAAAIPKIIAGGDIKAALEEAHKTLEFAMN
ncbi:extracellular solute-binding protein [Aestuariimicrobium ganziense]|uniref:extracellular solute-binding protein n=1 Tax=Aestuariimicrobium ganziense TaxID=2773677 RepID=UPI00194095B2|nr:extracellular solute-binding protein [Aestuariimicrobium ganziense]